jgi:hypothetical protein
MPALQQSRGGVEHPFAWSGSPTAERPPILFHVLPPLPMMQTSRFRNAARTAAIALVPAALAACGGESAGAGSVARDSAGVGAGMSPLVKPAR